MLYSICFLVFLASASHAQQTLITKDPQSHQRYQEAKLWFADEQYKLAYPVFKELENHISAPYEINKQLYVDELKFFTLACELMEDNAHAETASRQFMQSNASGHSKGQLGYYLGAYYFRKQDYVHAIEAFEKATVSNLNNQQVATMQFQQGYSYFTQKQFTQAKPLLNSVRQSTTSPYYIDANYYYGLLAFNDKQYKEALACFDIVKSHRKYENMVPYYRASINYALGEKEKGMALAESALKTGTPYYKPELQQLLGHGYFEKGAYKNAQPYLEQYVKSSAKVKREDLYELAYCYYIDQQYPKAIEQFKPLAGGDDSLSQHAMYLLGDAYLKTGQKNNARNAFLFCSSNSSNATFKEISLFNYGKLSYELGYDNEALTALKQYITQFPKGNNIDESKDLLVGVLGNTSNFKEALELYESIPNKSEMARRYYPRIAFNRAQELINDRDVNAAEALLTKTLAASYNESVAPLAHFWQGELDFAKGNYSEALQHYQDYLKKPVQSGEATTANAKYGLGYSLMKLNEYKQAAAVFNELNNASFASSQQQTDVTLRLADCYYMQKEFSKAAPLYSQVHSKRGFGADYAMFQSAMISGAQNNPGEKINTLKSVDNLFPTSPLSGAVNMEIADTYMADEKFKDALPFLNKVIAEKNNESLKPQAYLKSGLAQYNLDKYDEALQSFKILLKQYPQSAESDEAIDNVRNVFVEQGKPDGYISFLQEVGKKVDNNVADSITFVAAELQYSDGKKPAALAGFKNYISKFPEGRSIVEANYYAAEISRENKALKEAVGFYDAVASKAPNKYAERSLVYLSRIHYFDFKDYAKAAGYYQQLKTYATAADTRLESMRGLIRSQYYLKDYANAVTNAKELLQQGTAGSDDKIFANLVLGIQAKQEANCGEAIGYFKTVATLSKAEFGAEARYNIALCLYEQAKYADAEKSAFEVIQKSGSYANWVERSYLLLGDIYLKQQDFFNAKATYKSVAENASIPEVKQEAAAKLAKAEELSAAASKIGGQ
ncbi:MAG TPA: tetratricopeptide repeat protein [Phnomibacter sp.]|nr:tetratricopeptide repeat protein [Phnomibacter sp.]